MLSLSPTTRVCLRAGATDLRGGFEKLYQLARTGFGQDPLAGGQVFAFCNERRTRVKLLFHDSSGLWICTKRPDSGTFAGGRSSGGPTDRRAIVGVGKQTGGAGLAAGVAAA